MTHPTPPPPSPHGMTRGALPPRCRGGGCRPSWGSTTMGHLRPEPTGAQVFQLGLQTYLRGPPSPQLGGIRGGGTPSLPPASAAPPSPRGCAGSSRSRDPSGADGTRNTYGFAFQPPSQSCFSAGRRRGGRRVFFFFLFSLGILIFVKKKKKSIILRLRPGSPWAGRAQCSVEGRCVLAH